MRDRIVITGNQLLCALGEDPREVAQKLIAKAREETELLLQTPLQSKLDQLTFAGVIWDEKATIGLIETPDTKGHTIRVGSFIGPNFGVVQSIDEGCAHRHLRI